MVICLERDADLHVAQLMPLPLTVSCSSKIQIGFISLVLAHPGSPRQRAVKCVCVCVTFFNIQVQIVNKILSYVTCGSIDRQMSQLIKVSQLQPSLPPFYWLLSKST